MSRSRAFRAVRPHEGVPPRNSRESGAREQSRGLAIARIEPSHQHNHDRKMQAQRRVKRAR